MADKPRLLDLFCGAGGAAMGYHRAGFEVTGVDIKPQKNYPFAFIQGDALEYCAEHGHAFDAIHASPPCQGYSATRHLPWLADKEYPLLIEPVRTVFEQVGKPWVIENVERAPLSGCFLCGTMFDMPFYKHRRFESSTMLLAPPHAKHREVIGQGHKISSNNRNANGFLGLGSCDVEATRRATGISWMTAKELRQAIPPAYTEYIGRQLMQAVGGFGITASSAPATAATHSTAYSTEFAK